METLNLIGPVGDDWDGFTEPKVVKWLEDNPGEITVNINSPGGYAHEGIAIYNHLAARKPHVRVMGLAASAASIIAMSGERIEMATGSQMMIHQARAVTGGTADELEDDASALRVLNQSLAAIYSERSGMDREDVLALLNRDTWLTAEQAVELGLADEVATTRADAPDATALAVLKELKLSLPPTQDTRDRKRAADRAAASLAMLKRRAKAAT